MICKLETISISSIDTEDTTYRITTPLPASDLVRSISDIGLINPPILKQKGSKYSIISGFRRVEACSDLRCNKLECRIPGSDTSEINLIKIAISENSLQRPLNLIEQSRALNLISFYFDNDNLLKEASALGLPGNFTRIKGMKILVQLPQIVQEGIISGNISYAIAQELHKLPAKACTSIACLFRELKVGLNKQKEILNFAVEIAAREEIELTDVLEDRVLEKIINNDDIDRNQKTGKIRHYLKKKRYPAITAAEAEFLKNIKDLNLDNHTRLIPPKDFEGMTYSMNMSFNNIQELKDRKELLEKILAGSRHENRLLYW